jgi:peptidoglycan/LPS O-acetylase OafA/YrhL
VRGIAILLVLVAHYRDLSSAVPFDRALRTVTLLGYTGVDLFFVLSGFLITGILLDARGGRGFFRIFYARRALRILPLYYGIVVALVVVWPLVHARTPAVDAMRQNQAWYWGYAVNFIWQQPGRTPYNTGHFWSLAVEEQFYLVWPVIVWWLDRARLRRVCLACIVGAFLLRCWGVSAGLDVFSYVPMRMDTLALGALLAIDSRSADGLAPLAPWARWIGPAAGMLAAATFLTGSLWPYGGAVHATIGYTASAVAFAALVGAASTGWGAPILASRPLRFLGKYSYGIYVFHWPLRLFYGPVYALISRLPLVAGSSLLREVAFFVVASMIAVGVAVVSYQLYERWWLGLKRYVPEPVGPRR